MFFSLGHGRDESARFGISTAGLERTDVLSLVGAMVATEAVK